MALRGDDLFLSYGVMGGFMQVRTRTSNARSHNDLMNFIQPQGHVQVLLNMLRGFTAQAALDAPRFCISAGMPDPDEKDPAAFGVVSGGINFEDAIPASTIQKLRGMAFVFLTFLF